MSFIAPRIPLDPVSRDGLGTSDSDVTAWLADQLAPAVRAALAGAPLPPQQSAQGKPVAKKPVPAQPTVGICTCSMTPHP